MRLTSGGFSSVRSPGLAAGVTFFFAASYLVHGSPATSELGHPFVQDYPPGAYHAGHLCQTMTQDAAGVIYFASGSGVLSFDGATYGAVPLPTESGGVRKFAVTADGTIYLGGASLLGYFRALGQTAEYVTLTDRLPPTAHGHDDIFDVLAVGHTVYFSDEEEILIWRDGRFIVVPCRTPPHARGARLHRVGDTVYVTTLDRALCQLVDDRLEVVADDPVFRQNPIISVEAGPAGALMVLTAQRGFFRLVAGHVAPLEIDANRSLAGKTILRAQRLGDGSLAVAFTSVSGDGGMRFDSDGRYLGLIDGTTGLYVKTLRDFFCDREGGLWIGSETGMFRLEWPSAVTVFDAINGLGQGAVADVARHEGALYAATTEGAYRLVTSGANDGRGARFERVLAYPAYSLLSHPGGLLVLGYADLFAQAAVGFTSVAKLPPGGGLLHRSKRDPERVWISTARGVQSVRQTPQGWRDEGIVAGFNGSARELAEGSDGTLWVATPDRGLFRLDFGAVKSTELGAPHIERFAGGRGLPERFLHGSTATWAGEPVIMTSAAPRPFRFDASLRRFVPLAGTESLPADASDEGWSMSDTSTGESDALWLASPTSIYQVPRQGPPRRLPHLAKTIAGKISQMREENMGEGPVLWICGAGALVRVDVARAFPPPVPFVTRLSATGVREGDHLAPGNATLSFNFVALKQLLPRLVDYQTRLVGYERAWLPWSHERQRTFSNLSSGDYRFEVRGRDADGQVTKPALLAFEILTPWWLTGGALLGYTAAGLGLVAGFVRLRTRALRHRAGQLELTIAERTAELEKKNTELNRLHRFEFDEKIAARHAEEKSRLEALRYQLNPHFLYNTLASISSSLPAGHSTARTMVERLADFCRLTLHRSTDGEWTTLGEEMQLLRVYLEIEQSRWGDLLDVAIDCPPALLGERLPHFLLLPLVENALKYGHATSPDRVGLRLTASRAPDGPLVLSVANTGEWIEPAQRKSVSSLGIGLENLRERLSRDYPHLHEFAVSHAGGWVTVVLRIRPPSAV